jgi:uncharacterized damage-inducible protein DinB
METALEELLESWRTNNRINLFLIDHISPAGMKCTLSKRGGRNVVRQFAHLHNVRVWHLEKRAKELAKGLHRFDTHDEPGKRELKKNFRESAKRIEAFIEDCATGGGKYRCFKKGIMVNVAYFVAHESHHRGNILLTLKERGHNLDQKTRYRIWDWDRI